MPRLGKSGSVANHNRLFVIENLLGAVTMALDSDQVQKPVRKLRKILKKISRNPSPAKVHDLRTRTRQIEAALGALALDSNRNGRKLLKSLSRVRKNAGRVRDMDVLISYA